MDNSEESNAIRKAIMETDKSLIALPCIFKYLSQKIIVTMIKNKLGSMYEPLMKDGRKICPGNIHGKTEAVIDAITLTCNILVDT